MTGLTRVGALGSPFGVRLWNHRSGRGRKEREMEVQSGSCLGGLFLSFPKCSEIGRWFSLGDMNL